MSDIAAMLAWLREQVESDKATAEELDGHCMGQWYSAQELFDGWGPLDWDEAEHIARHSPRQVVADCAAKLAILDGHAVTVRLRDEAAERIRAAQGRRPDADDLATWNRAQSEAAVIEDLVRRLAQGYRHRPGWKEDWAV